MNRYALRVRSGLLAAGKFGAKASHIAGYASPVALAMGQPGIAATLEEASTISGGVSSILKNV